uniref:Lysozyme n=1 Tax=Panagrolaimus sp. PS1159 TaxID=55785 RepID=A0AC35G1J6_9BILA
MISFCVLIFVGFFIASNEAIKGWDGIQAVDAAGFQCLAQNGFEFYIGRIWTQDGSPSTAGIENIKAAREAGVKTVDGYMWPCTGDGCASASEQMDAALNFVNDQGTSINRIWIDIEEPESWWADKTQNQNFIMELLKKADERKIATGVYASSSMWNDISFEGYEAFGGWTAPTMHQFEGSPNGETNGPCGVSMDKNFRETM